MRMTQRGSITFSLTLRPVGDGLGLGVSLTYDHVANQAQTPVIKNMFSPFVLVLFLSLVPDSTCVKRCRSQPVRRLLCGDLGRLITGMVAHLVNQL